MSHETIYRSLNIQARGVLKKELLEHLRAKRTIRHSRHASLKGQGLGQIKDAVSISARPAEVEDRAVPGHGEGNLIDGAAAPSPPWSSATRATSFWSSLPARTPTASSPR